MPSRILQRFGRLIGLDVAGPDMPAELDTDRMGQVLAMLAGPCRGARRVVKAGRAGALVVTDPTALPGGFTTQGVLSVVAAWTFMPGWAPAPDVIIGATNLWCPTDHAFAPASPLTLLPLAGFLTVAGLGGGLWTYIDWPYWCVQPLPLGAGVAGICWANSYEVFLP